MKKIVFLFAVLCFLISGCTSEIASSDDTMPAYSGTGIIARAATIEKDTKSTEVERIVFTGNDMLWFNETTKEIRFKDNSSLKTAIANVQALKFYIDTEFLFTSYVLQSSSNTQTINSLVFVYNTTENKYYLLDGYPPVTNDLALAANEARDKNNQSIVTEWSLFINQLKKEGKYTK